MEQPRVQRTTEMPEDFKLIRENLLREFSGKNVEGINTKRAEEFIKKEGMEVKPYVIIEKGDLPKLQEIVGDSESFKRHIEEGGLGVYAAGIDLAIVFRDGNYEGINGEIFTERFLVHELAHASSKHGVYTSEPGFNDFPTVLRIGFCLRSEQKNGSWGELIEEGWAEMQSANYFARYATKEDKERLESILKLGSLGVNDTIPTGMFLDVPMVNVGVGEPLPLPLKYIFLNPEGRLSVARAAFAGYALEILCQNNLSLAPAMIEARKSLGGLRKFARTLWETSPDLYKTLQTSDYSARGFRKKLEVVINKVGGGVEKVIKARGPLKDKWDKILKK
ncbi:hypothetical protein HY798_04625 [Candidatus Falkowbacteria bacterium]|nr:hypothetical protein [Candidatus Falkowbacteria bacterium]